MIPRIGRQGGSFKGAAYYYLRDRGKETAERVEHAETRNLPTQDPELAWRIMAATAMDSERLKEQAGVDRRGRKVEKPVFHVSLSWHPEQNPGREHMVRTMDGALATLGLSNNQAVYVIHNDEPHPHIHAFLNLVNPENGRSNSVKFSKERLSDWAAEYEQAHGVYCEQRLDNASRRKEERAARASMSKRQREAKTATYPRHKEAALERKAAIAEWWQRSDSARAFAAAMEEMGFTLAQGRRPVLVDHATGKTYALARQLDGVSTRAVRDRLADLDLRSVDDARMRHPARPERHSPEAEAVRDFGRDAPRPPGAPFAATTASPAKDENPARNLNALQDAQLGQWGAFYERARTERAAAAMTIENAYGRQERALRHEIAVAEQANAKAGRLRRWYVARFTNRHQELAGKRATLADLMRRASEVRGAAEARLSEERAALTSRFAAERAAVAHGPSVTAVHAPGSLDPLATSMAAEQARQGVAFQGAAAPGYMPHGTRGAAIALEIAAREVFDADAAEAPGPAESQG